MNEIGLRRGTVELKDHNSKWSEIFENEKKILLSEFPDVILEVSHGGSTAIPTIPAKPIIDIFARVRFFNDIPSMQEKLESLGYNYRGEEGISHRILYAKGPEERRTHYLHLMEGTSEEWSNHLLIKDYYLKHPDVAQEYAELKKKLAEQFPDDRDLYSNGKHDFIQSVIKKAKKLSE